MRGEHLSTEEIKKDCDPIVYNADLKPYINVSVDGTELKDELPANPCGLNAKSIFTDKF